MSNEYKDWEKDKIEEENQIVAKYPFLRVRDLNGKPDVDADFPMIGLEIPNGWYKLFFQMCDDLMPVLEETGLLNDFYFLQVKEKFNDLICYTATSNEKIDSIIEKYENMAQYVCSVCGRPADVETADYILSFCSDCYKNVCPNAKVTTLEFEPTFSKFVRELDEYVEYTISFEEEWNRYLKNFEA